MVLSIVTINFNDKKGLEKTIHSVKKLKSFFENEVEHIIIDGKSDDGSAELLSEYINNPKIIIEKDNGPCDALNKGINASEGSHILFLNSGDYLNPALTFREYSNLIESLGKNRNTALVASVKNIDIQKTIKPPAADDIRSLSMIHHQGTFYPSRAFGIIGGYDQAFGMRGDLEFNLRYLTTYSQKIERIDLCISIFQGGGMTSSYKGSYDFFKLGLMAYKKYGHNDFYDNFYIIKGATKQLKRFLKKVYLDAKDIIKK